MIIRPLILLLLLSYQAAVEAGGYEDGYQDAKCSYQDLCTPPVAPVPPVAPYGQDDYQDQYRRGADKAEEEGTAAAGNP